MLGSRYPSAVCEQLAQEQAIFGVGLSSDSEISIKTKSWSPAYVFQYTVIDNKILIKFLYLFFLLFWMRSYVFFSDNPQHILYVPNTIYTLQSSFAARLIKMFIGSNFVYLRLMALAMAKRAFGRRRGGDGRTNYLQDFSEFWFLSWERKYSDLEKGYQKKSKSSMQGKASYRLERKSCRK